MTPRQRKLEKRVGLEGEQPSGALECAVAFVLRHSGRVLMATLLLVAGAGYLASGLPLVTNFAELLPEHSRSVRDHEQSKKYLGNTSLLVVLVRAKNNDESGTRARDAAAKLAELLRADPEFDRVVYKLDRAFFERNGLLFMTVAQLEDVRRRLAVRIKAELLAHNPLYVDLGDDDDDDDATAKPKTPSPDVLDPVALRKRYFAKRHRSFKPRDYFTDGKTYLILTQPRSPAADTSYNKMIVARVRSLVDDARTAGLITDDIKVDVSGNYLSAAAENDSVKADLRKAGLVSLALLIGVVLFYFRRTRALWTIFVPLLSGVIVMMGYVRLSVGRLNTITGFCFALFMGLSIDFAIHFLARYDEERGRGASVYRSLLATYSETGKAALAAAATSAVGFLSLVAADFKGFREFGIIAGGGILICLGVIAVQLPALIAFSTRFVEERRFAVFKPEVVMARRRLPEGLIAVAGLLAIGLIVYQAIQVRWEGDLRNLRGGSQKILKDGRRAFEIMGRSTQPAVRLASSLAEARRLTAACNEVRKRRGQASTVAVCASLSDFIPQHQPKKLSVIAKIRAQLADRRLRALEPKLLEKLDRLRANAPTKPIVQADLPDEVLASFVSSVGGKYFVKAYPIVEMWVISNNEKFVAELHQIDEVSAHDLGPVGSATIMSDSMKVMKRDAVVVVVVALVAVFLVLLCLFWSVPRALACYVPLVLGITATVGVMAMFNMRLGFFNMIVVPSLIGIGVDNNIYLMHRYHLEGRGSWRYVVSTTGWACIMAAVTTMVGFAGLSLASHAGLRSIGNMAILGVLLLTTISILVVPAVFALFERRNIGTAFGLLPGHVFKNDNALASGKNDTTTTDE